MKRLMATGLLATTLGAAAGAQQLSFTSDRWRFTGDSTRIESFQGRESLRMETGEAARPDVVFEDGTIDVDIMTTPRRSFVYVNFRVQGDGEQEEFYLRPHKSSLPDAAQYAPAFQKQSAWQLYYGARGTAAPNIVASVWQHLRIVVCGRRAAFFLGDTIRPFMVIAHLARVPGPGHVSLRSFVPAGTPPGEPAARFSNLTIRPGLIAYDFGAATPEPALPSGVVQKWQVGRAFAAPDSAISSLLPEWERPVAVAAIEPEGFVELHRSVPMVPVQRYVGTVARFTVVAAKEGLRRFDLGFSDRATIFLNGKPMFFGENSYDFENRRDGLISFDQAAVYLPLRSGANEIAIVVTDRFGGWGIMGRFPDMRGLTISPR